MGTTAPFPVTDMIMIGCQDKETIISKGTGTDHNWNLWGFGDGMESFIDYTNEDFLYDSWQGGLSYSQNRNYKIS